VCQQKKTRKSVSTLVRVTRTGRTVLEHIQDKMDNVSNVYAAIAVVIGSLENRYRLGAILKGVSHEVYQVGNIDSTAKVGIPSIKCSSHDGGIDRHNFGIAPGDSSKDDFRNLSQRCTLRHGHVDVNQAITARQYRNQ